MDEGVSVVVEELHTHPVCEHGPTILFEYKNNIENDRKFFACSAYRERKDCPVHVAFDQWNYQANRAQHQTQLDEFIEKSSEIAVEQQKLLQRVLELKPSKRCYCHSCGGFIIDAVKCDRLRHDVDHGVSNERIEKPTTFLKPKSNDKREAQYFFNETSLNCFTQIFQTLGINKIICIGAPRLHEHLLTQSKSLRIESILLDFDERFHSFHNRNGSMDFFHYNMFNNYFFGGTACESKFAEFLLCKNNEKCCIFTDPPFGCRTELLASTLHMFHEKYRKQNNCPKIMPIFLILPYFMEHYVKAFMPEMTMLDYKVNYTNHDSYKDGGNRKLGSPARLFSNVLSSMVRLPSTENYQRCRKCDRWVAAENKHCNRCRLCPSKNGAAYKHCKACETCVKPSYKHCYECWRCTQIQNHSCAEYQFTLTCAICLRRGHNEPNCRLWFDFCKKNIKEIHRLKAKVQKTGLRICFICFKNGHSESKCTKRAELLGEQCFLNQNYNLLSLNKI